MQRNRRNRSPQRGGFTLLEVMIVLFILVMLASMAVYAVRGQQAKAQRQGTFAYINLLKGAVKRYEIDMGGPPTTEEGIGALITAPSGREGAWGGPYIEDTATNRDPWGNEYQYASPGREGREFEIWSFGPDRTNGTDDDIGSWMSTLD